MRNVSKTETTQHLKNLAAYGYTRVADFMGSETLARLKLLVERLHKETKHLPYAGRPDRDVDDKIIYNLQNKDKYFIDILADPFIKRTLMEKLNDPYYRFLPQDVPNYILSYYNARSSGRKLDLHIDTYIPFHGEWTWAMQVAFILDDQTEANGCTTVVPGSHLSGRYTDRDLENVVPLPSRGGDLVLWDSRLWHGTLENAAKTPRWSLIATFTTWWVKQNMDMTRSLPNRIYRQLTEEQKALLGFCSIPPKDETGRINTKSGYDTLLDFVEDYYK